MPRENLHVTLKFLGNVADERIEEIAAAVGDATAGMVDFAVRLGPPGVFPSARRARVLWIGLEDPAGGLAALAGSVEESLTPLGFPAEGRAFTAHLTIGRVPRPQHVSLPDAGAPGERFVVDRLALVRSRLGRPAARYEALATFPFRRES